MVTRSAPHRGVTGAGTQARPSGLSKGRAARRPWERTLASTGLLVAVLVTGACTTSQAPSPTPHPTVHTPSVSSGPNPTAGSSTESTPAAGPTGPDQTTQGTPSPPLGTVEVVMTYSQRAADGFVEVGGYVPGYITDRGRCRASSTDATIVGQWTEAVPDAAGTSCGALRLKIGAGSADVVIEFVSDSEQGRSAPRTIGAE